MVPVANRPVIEYILELLKAHGIIDVTITLQYLPGVIMDHVKDGSSYGLRVDYVREETPLGTAGSVRHAVRGYRGTVLVISGDCLTDFDLSAFLAAHCESRGRVTLGLTRVTRPLEYGVVITAPDGRVVKFLEKPSWGEVFSDTVNTGLYLLAGEVLDQVPDGPYDFSRDLFPRLLSQGERLHGVVLDGYWCDIGDLDQYRRAQVDALNGRVAVKIPGRELAPGVWVEPGVKIGGTVHSPAVIGAGALVAPGAVVGANSCLGRRSRLEAGARLKQATIWEGTTVGPGAEVLEAVAGEGSFLHDDSSVYARAVVGDNSRVERGARVGPGVKVWPGQIVPAGRTLSRHLAAPGQGLGPLLHPGRVEGTLNRELLVEDACRLGTALGSLGGVVVLGHSKDPAARAVAAALSAGVWACGQDTVELGVTMPQLARYAVTEHERAAGAYVAAAGTGMVIRLLDQDGGELVGARLRRLEQALERPETAGGGRVGIPRAVAGVTDRYLDWVTGAVKSSPGEGRRLRLLAPSPARELLDSLCYRLAVECTHDGDDQDLELLVEDEEVRLGHRGAALDAGTFLVLTAHLFFASGGTRLAVPVHAPGVLEELARQYQGEVVRLPAAGPGFAARAREIPIDLGRKHIDQGRFWSDEILRVTYVISRLTHTGQTLAQALARLPVFNRVEVEIPCPWEQTGKVMRELIAGYQRQHLELVDGVRVLLPDGWVLARPDGQKAAYRIYAEASNMETAAELADSLAERVRCLLQS